MMAKVRQTLTEAFLEGITPEVDSTDDLSKEQTEILEEALRKIEQKSDKQLQRAFQSRLKIKRMFNSEGYFFQPKFFDIFEPISY